MHHKKQIITFSIFFFIILTASNSYDSLVAYMFEQLHMPDVGPASLAVLYLSFALSLIFTPAIRLSIKTQFLIVSAIFPLNYALGLYASTCNCHNTIYWLVSFGTSIGGIGNGILWVNQGKYVHLICEVFDCNEERGRMFSLFGVFYCASLLASAVVTLIGFGYFSVTVYFTILVVLTLIALLYCFFFLKDIEQIGGEELERLRDSKEQDRDDKIEKVQQLLDKECFNKQSYDLKDFLCKFFSYIPQMLCLLPMFIIQAICLGVSSNIYFHLIPSQYPQQLKNKYTGLIRMVNGVAAILGIYILGFIFDSLGTIFSGRLSLGMYFVCCWLFILALNLQSVAATFIMPFLWSFVMRYQFGLFPVICSKHYEGATESFSVIKLIPAVFNIIFQVMLIFTKNQVTPLMFALFSLIAVPALYWLNALPVPAGKFEENQNTKLSQQQP